VRNVAARSTIWGKVDIAAFCRITGYSREHTIRTLSLIRRQSFDLVFETKLCRRKRGMPKRWGVIVADRAKLKYDQRSLFYDDQGRRLHNYTNLGKGRVKIPPTRSTLHRINPIEKPSNQNRMQKAMKTRSTLTMIEYSTERCRVENSEGPCSSPPFQKREGSVTSFSIFRIPPELQQSELYGAERGVAQSGANDTGQRPGRHSPLRRKAFAMLRRLANEHWDNCKVTFSHRTGFRYALDALAVGHEEERILDCYSRALFVCHGLATDIAASSGEIVYFNPSSTVTKARRFLERDGLTAKERIAQWYRNRQKAKDNSSLATPLCPPSVSPPEPLPDDVAELRRKIAESLGCDLPDDLYSDCRGC